MLEGGGVNSLDQEPGSVGHAQGAITKMASKRKRAAGSCRSGRAEPGPQPSRAATVVDNGVGGVVLPGTPAGPTDSSAASTLTAEALLVASAASGASSLGTTSTISTTRCVPSAFCISKEIRWSEISHVALGWSICIFLLRARRVPTMGWHHEFLAFSHLNRPL
jgi:hypothetical protein